MSDKPFEILRTKEVCLEILDREGITSRGLLLLTYFLKDQGRSLEELLEVWHLDYLKSLPEAVS